MRFALVVALVWPTFGFAQEEPAKRLPPRAEQTAAEREAATAKLRTTYAEPAAWPKPTLDDGVMLRELGLLPAVEHPKANPFTKAKAELGKALFFDGRLSASGQTACVSCHDPDLAWGDGRTSSFGHDRKHLKRNAPTLMNCAFLPVLFWDGRAASLEEQAKSVLNNADEMRYEETVAVARLKAIPGYAKAFTDAFASDAMTTDRIADAIACFERTLVGGRSRFDQFLKGKPDVLTDAEVRGLHLFRTDARCLNCHSGPTLSDGKFHDIGLSYYGRTFEDLGRFRITKQAEHVGSFRTPSLRNVAKTGPYMHNGLFELDEILRLYNAGMPTIRRTAKHEGDPLFPVKSPHLKPLGLNKTDLADLEAFLNALSEPPRKTRPPTLSLPLADQNPPAPERP